MWRWATGAEPLLLAVLDEGGRLLLPADYEAAPSPPALMSSLSLEQQARWEKARAAEFNRQDYPLAVRWYETLLAEMPPGELAANAVYNLGMLHQKEGEVERARAHFERVARDYPAARSESGLPLQALALWQQAQLALAGTNAAAALPALRAVLAHAVYQPSSFSAFLLEQAAALETAHPALAGLTSPYREVWQSHEKVRRVARALAAGPSGWVEAEGGWLVMRAPSPEGGLLLGWSAAVVEARMRAVLREASQQFPPYFGAQIEVAGRGYQNYAATSNTLVSVVQTLRHELAPVKTTVAVVNPDLLYARQRQRTWMFGGLIGGSSLAALLGFLAAWRAFQRQLRLNEQKSNFVSSVSHELRTPVASVRLMAEGLERGRVTDPARQAEYHRLMVQECRRLGALIDNVLDDARIEQGRKQYEFEPCDLSRLVGETVRGLEPYAAEKGVRLVLEAGAAAAAAAVEPVWDGRAIQQALVNLLDNAIKHSPRDSTVTVGLELPAGSAPDIVSLWVEDRGPGIPGPEQERIFERFYRLGSELRRETAGAGIGLSIVRHIVAAHGGRVGVRSAPGQGSRFTLELPLHPKPET